MLGKLFLGCVLVVTVGVVSAAAEDVKHKFLIKDALQLEQVKKAVGSNVEFFWGNQPAPSPVKNFGVYMADRRTNGVNKVVSQACALTFAEALASLKSDAEREGGNAIINIVSTIKGQEESSATEYTCMVGKMMVNVALKGNVVTIKK